ARTVCVTALADGKWMNHRIEDALNKNQTRMLLTFQDNLTSICSLVTFLASDDTNVVSVEASGDDDDVTCSAGKKRKHWKTWADEG
uniref:hypothetical protein n=1 Tax=Salmonella sp. s54925 TaxID=3159674 RepID=UPI00397FD4EC